MPRILAMICDLDSGVLVLPMRATWCPKEPAPSNGRKLWRGAERHVSFLGMDTDENAPTAHPATAMITTPLANAIRRAAESHPSIIESPTDVREARSAAVTATASAMADAEDADFGDPFAAQGMAPQMVDEAALALGMSHDRTVPVDLMAETLTRHHALARTLATIPRSAAAGFGCASAIARSEKAIGRALRIRAAEFEHDDETESHLTSMIIGAMIKTCVARGVTIETMDDDDLMTLVEDASDFSLHVSEVG